MAVTFEHFEIYGGRGNDTVTHKLPSHGSLGGPEAGDLMLLLIGARSKDQAGATLDEQITVDGWELVTTRGPGFTYQTATYMKVATDDDAGSDFTVHATGNGNLAIHYLRFSKESENMAWRVNGDSAGFSPSDGWRRTVADVNLSISGIVVAFNFVDQGAQSFWNEYSEYDNNLGGYPQEITRNIDSTGRGYHRRVSMMDKDGLQGVGAGEDGLPEIIGDVDPPEAPAGLEEVSRTHRSVTFKWEPAETNGLIEEYLIYQGAQHVATLSGVTLRTTVKGLSSSSNYGFRVRARDVAEQLSPYSAYLQVETDPAPEAPEEEEEPEPASPTAPSPVRNLRVVGVSERGIRISWSPPSTGEVDEYHSHRRGSYNDTIHTQTTTTRRFGGLKSGTSYVFNVRAIGPGGASDYRRVRQRTKKPPPKKRYTKTFSATWSRSYRSAGPPHSNTDALYHGYADGFNGNARTLIGFNDSAIRRYLKGAEILDIYFRVYVEHTWWNSGGRFRYGYCTRSNQPSSWRSSMVSMRGTSPNVTRGQTVNIGLTNSVGRAFRSGKARGICLGPASSNSSEYYLKFKKHAKLVIKYRK